MNASLQAFLNLGYFLDYDPKWKVIDDTKEIDRNKYMDITAEDLIKVAGNIFHQSISDNFKTEKKNVVPLSGGLDSRAILAGLLEHTEARNIYTYTFGTPGTLDYEIGCEVAKKLGTKHTALDLTQLSFQQSELEDISKRVDHQAILFHHWPVWEVDKHFQGAEIWSGFMGDPLSGSHLSNKPSETINQAISSFLSKNQFVKSTRFPLTAKDISNQLNIPAIPKEKLTLDEQLDFFNRQMKYIAPLVLMKGYNFRTPFLHKMWVNFTLSIPNRYRRNQLLYKQMLIRYYQDAFSIRTKNNGGLSLNTGKKKVYVYRLLQRLSNKITGHRDVNYIDFNKGIRKMLWLKEIFRHNIYDLAERNIIEDIDIKDLYNRHINQNYDHADALITLCSLEIHLKAGKRIC